ncbi:MAG: SRPBCC family protein, partial [Pseudonocardia sp.]|nr:SRPBCC family protein [Pseudonocardia sp.]
MQLEHSFTVPTSVDAVWEALLDPERVAPCMPGATLTGVDGKKFTGKVKVKLGPVSMQYKGTGEYADTDAGTRTVVIEASGKDARGNGTASATVTLRLTGDAAKTEGTTTTDLTVTGKPAQFGRGMISDVGGKILEQFAANLADELAAPDAAGATETAKPENTSGTSGSGTSDTSAAAA